jgi:hypothetical protein
MEMGEKEMHLPGTRKDENLLYRDFFGERIKRLKVEDGP